MKKITNSYVEKRFQQFIQHTVNSINDIPCSPGLIDACNCIGSCKGKIILSGIGKAGHAARKAASSFSSLGIPSVFIHPGEASHGDSGVIDKEDVLMVFSTSGKTREVLELIQIARSLDVQKIISVTSHIDSEVRKVSDIVVNMGLIKEAGHLSIAPTTSILVMLTLSDLMAVIVAEAKRFNREHYSIRHHGGYLGKLARGEINDKR